MRKGNYCLLLLLGAVASGQSKRVFLVDKTYTTGSASTYGNNTSASAAEMSYSPKIIKAFAKCPSVSFTMEKDSADLVLNPQVGGSILSNKKGDVLYISPAKLLGNMVKDVCGFISKNP